MYNGNQIPYQESRKITFLQLLVLGLFCLIVLRLWYFQIYKGKEYTRKAQDNILRHHSVYAPRGLIRDRDGVILAENKPAYGLALVRENCKDIDKALAQVSKWSDVSFNKLKNKFQNEKSKVKSFAPQLLISNMGFHDLARIKSHIIDWPGLCIVTRPIRYYSQAPIASHVIGYVAKANEQELKQNSKLQLGDRVGKQGLELALEDKLRGQKGLKQAEVNANGRELREKIIRQPIPGQDISLTIDLELQNFANQQMGEHAGAVVVMNPSNGDLLALVSKPGYNNNRFVQGLSKSQWKSLSSHPKHPLQNRAIQSAYPPGSVFKLVTAACALSRNSVDPEEKKYCPAHYRHGNRVFQCWKEQGHGWLGLKEAIKQSCDVYFYKLGENLGVDCLSSYARKCGLGQNTGIILPNEEKGLIPDRHWKLRRMGRKWQGGETLNMSIGQGYTLVTPLQIARFVCALVNGGNILKPNLLKSQEVQTMGHLPLTADERNFLLKAMKSAVEEPHGTAWRLRTKEATIGAKTGTAQVVKLFEDSRDKELSEIPYKFRDHAWMASYGSKGQNTYVVVVLVEHGGHGGSGAGPIVKTIFDHLFATSPDDH